MDETQISTIVQRVLDELKKNGAPQPAAAAPGEDGLFDDMEAAIDAAQAAQKALSDMTLENRKEIIAAIRKTGLENADEIARQTVEETGMGNVADKAAKMKVACTKTPGVEDLDTVAWSGDHGLTVVEMAPFGVIGAITPSTHPVPTLFNNAIGMIAAGNSAVVNPHPGAKNVSNRGVQLLNRAVQSAGGPANLITSVRNTTMETGTLLFNHPKINLLCITGGPGVVRAAMKAPKRAICAGPGNPPVVVDETADLAGAAESIILGATFDNNLLCISEKTMVVVESVAEDFKRRLVERGAFELTTSQMDALAGIVFRDGGKGAEEIVVNRDYVGRDAQVLARAINVEIPSGTKMLFGETAPDHPFVRAEQMMNCLPLLRAPDWQKAIETARVAENFFRHTAIMHSKNVERLTRMGKIMDCTLFVKNGPSVAGVGVGGEGYMTHSMASPTGEGITSARTFTRMRRCTMVDYLRIV